jgi:hypothetical protein
MLALTTCSVKHTIFEGVPGDAALIDDAASVRDDPPLIADAFVVTDDAPAADAAVPTDAPVIDSPVVDGRVIDVLADAPVIDAPVIDAPVIDACIIDAAIDARSCAELRDAGMPSGVYWVRPTDTSERFQAYCEQGLEGGGWAMLENSVRREDGTTTAFWQFGYADRLSERGTLAPDQNYYNGALYRIGGEYMDMFTDLQNKTAVAAVMSATGIDPVTMRFIAPTRISGDPRVYEFHFAAGWSAQDFDGDSSPTSNCAADYNNVAQHYRGCWFYNLGADVQSPRLDGGVGPHVFNEVLTPLGLAIQPNGGGVSQVNRIARFTRW